MNIMVRNRHAKCKRVAKSSQLLCKLQVERKEERRRREARRNREREREAGLVWALETSRSTVTYLCPQGLYLLVLPT